MLSILENDFIGFELLFHETKMIVFGKVKNQTRTNQSYHIPEKLTVHNFQISIIQIL